MQRKKLLLAAVVCAVSVTVMLAALLRPQTTFTPPPFEAAAQSGTPENVPDVLGYGTLDATAYTVALCGMPKVEDGAAVLWLTNPAQNTVWLKIRICSSDGTLLGESGLLRPGEYLQKVPLDTVPTETAPVTLRLMAYEPETYRSAGAASLNTTLIAE